MYLDGKLAVGETPTMIEVTDDDFHELRVEKNGFETATRALTPDDHDPTITLSLTARAAAARHPDGRLQQRRRGVDRRRRHRLHHADARASTCRVGSTPSRCATARARKAEAQVKIAQGQTRAAPARPEGAAATEREAGAMRRAVLALLCRCGRRRAPPSRARCAWRRSRPTAPPGRASSRRWRATSRARPTARSR